MGQIGVGSPHLQDVDNALAHLGQGDGLLEGRAPGFLAADLDLHEEVLPQTSLMRRQMASGKRARFSMLPPYSSVRRLVIGERN